MPVEKIIIGRDRSDLKKYGDKGTAFIGKHIVGKGEEAHLTNPIHMDFARPHIVLVCGKRGSGKCMTPSTPVFLPDGSIRCIEDIFKEFERDGKIIIDNEKEKFVKLKRKLEVLSLTNDMKIEKRRVSHIYKKKIRERAIKMRTRSGREIVVTKEHPFLTFTGSLKWKKAEELSLNDYIALPRKLTSYSNAYFNFLNVGIPSTKMKSGVKSKVLIHLLNGKCKISKLAKKINSDKVWSAVDELKNEGLVRVYTNSPLTAELTERGRSFALELNYDYRRTSLYSKPIKIPRTIDVNFAEFMAYILAEGCEQKKNTCRFIFSNTDACTIKRFKNVSNTLFGVIPADMKSGCYIDSLLLEEILSQIGYEICKKSREKFIPEIILKSDEKVIKSFLRVFFDCEAYVSKSAPLIEVSTASEKIALQLSTLLLRFGIFPYIKRKLKYATNTKKKIKRRYFILEIYGSRNLKSFEKHIGFYNQRKSKILKTHIKTKHNPNIDIIPNVGKLIKNTRTILGLKARELHKYKQVIKSYEDGKYNPSRKFLGKIVKKMNTRLLKIEKTYKKLLETGDIETVEQLIEETSIKWKNIIERLNLKYKGKGILKSNVHKKRIIEIVKEMVKNILEISHKNITLLSNLAESDIFWDKIIEIREEFLDGWVYDLTVPETNNFIAGFGGIVCHNSYTGAVIAEEMVALPDDIKQNLSIILIDTMGIYWSMKYKNTKELDLLKKWNMKPKAFDLRFFVPKIHTKYYEDVGIKPIPFIIPCNEISAEDWLLTFGFSLLDEHGIAIERAVKNVRKKKKIYNIDDIIAEVEADNKIEQKVKDAIVNRFLMAKDWGVFGEKGTSILDIFQPGKISVLDISHYMRVAAGWGVRSMIVGLLARRAFNERLKARKMEEFEVMTGEKRKTIPMIWFVIDECHQFLPAEGQTAASEPLLTLVKEGREPGISILMITQMPNKLHQEALAQADLIISHRLTARSDLESLRSIMQTYVLEDIQELINSLPRQKGTAIILDDNSERMYAVQIRPRLSWHAGGSPSAIKEKGLFD